MCKMEKQKYAKHLTENILRTYKISNKQKISNIDFTAKKITEKLSIEDGVQIMEELEAYIIVKSHKDEFSSKIPCRLIKLSKPCLGKFIKVNLDKIY